MKDIFKPEDFRHSLWKILDEKELSIVVAEFNNNLNKLIESWPLVYVRNFIGSEYTITDKMDASNQARLAFIEPIVKEPAKERTLSDMINEYMTPDEIKEALELADKISAFYVNLRKQHCSHKKTSISEPHLAGARTCDDCGMYYNPNMGGWVSPMKKF